MALHEVTQEIRSTIYGWYTTLTGKKTERSSYLKHIIIAVLGLIIAGGTLLMYRWYVSYRERASQRIFTQYVDEYRRAYQQNAGWEAVEDLFQLGADQQSNSYLHPYFLIFQADALIKEDKKEAALVTLEKAVNALDASDAVAPLFKMKYALLQIDMPDEATQQVGLKNLISLTQDETNKFRDAAQFFLGDYYWAQGNIQEAQNVWNALVQAQQDADISTVSPWAQRAHQKLAQIA